MHLSIVELAVVFLLVVVGVWFFYKRGD